MRESTYKTVNKVMVYSLGILATFTREITKLMSAADMEKCIGWMDHITKGSGRMGCSTVKASYIHLNMG